jgi:hypothetical protein
MVLVNQLNIEGFELLEGLYAEQEIDIILHSSLRTKNDLHRRVIHLEFCSLELPLSLEWNEKYSFSPIGN